MVRTSEISHAAVLEPEGEQVLLVDQLLRRTDVHVLRCKQRFLDRNHLKTPQNHVNRSNFDVSLLDGAREFAAFPEEASHRFSLRSAIPKPTFRAFQAFWKGLPPTISRCFEGFHS